VTVRAPTMGVAVFIFPNRDKKYKNDDIMSSADVNNFLTIEAADYPIFKQIANAIIFISFKNLYCTIPRIARGAKRM